MHGHLWDAGDEICWSEFTANFQSVAAHLSQQGIAFTPGKERTSSLRDRQHMSAFKEILQMLES